MIDDEDDITQGMVRYLLDIPEVVDLFGSFTEGPAAGTPWIFQGEPHKIIEGSQQAALVVYKSGGWAAPNLHNSANFPRMVTDIWVDPLRDGSQNIVSGSEARRRANTIHRTLDKYLHLPYGFDMMWGDIRVISSVRLNEFDTVRVSDGDGIVVGSAWYGISVG